MWWFERVRYVSFYRGETHDFLGTGDGDPCGGRTVVACVDSVAFAEKPEQDGGVSARMARDPHALELTVPELASMLSEGHAVVPGVCVGGRREANWRQQELFMVDVDNDGPLTLGITEAVERAVNMGLPLCLSYETYGSTRARQRFRLGFLSPGPIADAVRARAYLRALLAAYPEADPACADLSRLFFGTDKEVCAWGLR